MLIYFICLHLLYLGKRLLLRTELVIDNETSETLQCKENEWEKEPLGSK